MKRTKKQPAETRALTLVSGLGGAHPIFGDLERNDALGKTFEKTLRDEDVCLLHRLLTDAHERLNESTGVMNATLEALGEENRDFSAVPKKVEVLRTRVKELHQSLNQAFADHAATLTEMKGVEAMAEAFVLLVRDENVQIDLLHASEETTDAVNTALDVLALEGQ
jgi:hypothetical protein